MVAYHLTETVRISCLSNFMPCMVDAAAYYCWVTDIKNTHLRRALLDVTYHMTGIMPLCWVFGPLF